MQTYDVYLKKRLTEINVIITQLVQRDSFSMYDWLYMYCSMGDLEIRKNLNVDSAVFLNAKIDDILEKVHEKIFNEMHLDVDVNLLNGVLTSGETVMELFASEMDVVEKSFSSGDSVLEISVDPLDYSIAHSFDRTEFDMMLLVNELETLKCSLEKFMPSLELSADIDFSSLKNVGVEDINLYLDVAPTSIFYQLTTGGNAITHMFAEPISDYVLKKVLHDVNAEMYLSASADIDWQLKKFAEIENSLCLLADMTDVLIQFIFGQTEMYLDCMARAGLKRYRLLSEMDDHPLSDFDDMTLEEVDYVILAE